VSSTDPLVAIADELYAVPAEAFTEARNAAVRQTQDKELAGRVKALRKPSTAAWAVNLLVRREAEQIDQVLALGASLREAAESMQGEELRALTRQRRQLTAALASTARSLAREADVRLSQAVVDQVEAVLNAAMLDPVAADAVRAGLLVKAFTSTGVSQLDVDGVLAVPGAIGSRATPVERPKPELRVVPEDGDLKRARAQDAVDQATAQVEAAQGEVDEAARAVADLEARRLQVREEIDELRRRLADIEGAADQVEEELDEAVEARDEAAGRLAEAQAGHERAVRALERLAD
jgi:vacuolar-type H+-ATPase subunit I/STV1